MALYFAPRFFSGQLFTRIPVPTSDFSGQTVIITGSNTGLGKEAARHIARLGAVKLILAVRTLSKGEDAANEIAKSVDIPRSRIEVWPLVMNDNDSIKAFAKRAEALQRLDAVVLNAGIMQQNSWSFFNDIESHIAVNVLGTILLAQLLLPTMQRSAQQTGLRGRLAIVGSEVMVLADLKQLETNGLIIAKLNDVAGQQPSQARYMLSKLLVKYSVTELAARNPLSKSNVIITDLTPGMCESDLFREEPDWLFRIVVGTTKATLARSCEVGSRTLVYGAVPELPAEAHGGFLWNNQVSGLIPNETSQQGRRLAEKWNKELFSELERVAPGCTKRSLPSA